jgi:hypothetical protein
MMVYGESGQAQPRYRTWNGAAWSAASTMPTIGTNPYWVRLEPDPDATSNTVIAVMADGAKQLEVNEWNGSAWGTNVQFTADQGADHPRMFDVAYEPGIGRAFVVYRKNGSNFPVYRVWGGSSWSAEQSGPNVNRVGQYMRLAPGRTSGEIFLTYCDDQADLHMFKWNGSVMSTWTTIETTLATGEQPANVISGAATWSAKVMSWTEVAPQ